MENKTEKPVSGTASEQKNNLREQDSSSSNKPEITDKKQEDKKIKKKKETEEKPKKTEAVVNGKNLPISTKYAVAICNYIRGKNIDDASAILEQVENFKKAIPMKGEIPHRKGKIMSGKYPVKAVKEFIKLLKSLKTNAIANELELEKYVIFCKANIAARPYKRFGRTRFKRTHVQLKLILPVKKFRKSRKASKKTASEQKSVTQEKISEKKSSLSEKNSSNDKKSSVNKPNITKEK